MLLFVVAVGWDEAKRNPSMGAGRGGEWKRFTPFVCQKLSMDVFTLCRPTSLSRNLDAGIALRFIPAYGNLLLTVMQEV